MGSRHQDEGFGEDFALPPDRAYSETCAGVGSIMFSWRLLLAQGAARYADLIERTLYNVVATSPAEDGRAFYYANTLHQREEGAAPDPEQAVGRAESSLRAPWFHVSCCPGNVARTLASLAAYVATTDDDGLQVHQYAPGTIRTRLPDGRAVELDVETDYPRHGRVVLRSVADQESAWTLSMRVPSWAQGASLVVDGERRTVAPGTVEVSRTFRPGDEVVLELPVEPRFTWPDPRIDAVRGCVAVERGPEVLCVESVDLPGSTHVDGLVIDTSVAPREVDGRVVVRAAARSFDDADWPYGAAPSAGGSAPALDVPLVPYHDWANRGPATMRVWIPTQ